MFGTIRKFADRGVGLVEAFCKKNPLVCLKASYGKVFRRSAGLIFSACPYSCFGDQQPFRKEWQESHPRRGRRYLEKGSMTPEKLENAISGILKKRLLVPNNGTVS